MNREPEYGNDECCQNCGDEWSPLTDNGYCEECQNEWEKYSALTALRDEGKE